MNSFSASLFGVLLAVLLACQADSKKTEAVEEIATEPCLFNLSRTFTPEESNLSFPLWFDDSIVRSMGIQRITRTLYANSDDADTNELEKREVKQYTFNKEGRVIEFYVEYYYDHTLVGSMSFTFDKQDEYGFAQVHPRKGVYTRGDDEIFQQYRMYTKEKYARKFLVYEDLRNSDYLFFMLKEAHWGPLSVDSILHPERQDLIVLGTPKKPHKRYKVENRVNEHDVILFDYTKDALRGISFDKYPFHYERSLTFDAKGRCTGFIDSTFSNQRFLTRKQANFTSSKGLVREIVYRNDTEMAGTGYFQTERLEYTFFEKK
jgi:hypothetical protein